jgi:integrase/recombinase XerD
MPQAKTLTEKELKIVLATVATGRHAARNRAMVLMSFWAGLRAGEMAALRVSDVLAPNGTITAEIRLDADQTKGQRGRVVMLGDKLRKELAVYISNLKVTTPAAPLFYSQVSRKGMSANTVAQLFLEIYAKAGVVGASSHSGRRTFITTLANKGVGVRVLMALAGHRHMSTTHEWGHVI